MERRTLLKQLLAMAAMPSVAIADQSQKPRILFTGFKPWSNSPRTNISEDMLIAFQPELEAAGVEIQLLDVSYKAIDSFLETFNPDNYDYIVNFGVDTRDDAKAITVEVMAPNRKYFYDDNGDCPFDKAFKDENACINDGSQPYEVMLASPLIIDLLCNTTDFQQSHMIHSAKEDSSF